MAEHPQIFNDGWEYGKLPEIDERRNIDYATMAAVGSCFARNLNRWLGFHGLTDREMPWGILYNPFSIQGEIARTYNNEVAELARDNVLREVGSDGLVRYRDPWRTWITADNKRDLNDTNTAFDAHVRNFLSNTRSFLITLGLAEVWSPEDKSITLNHVPVGSIRAGDRAWRPRFANVTEVRSSLEATIDSIRTHITGTGPIVFTLSPVPLKFTASGLNIREANNRSKATLAVALGEVAASQSNTEYFPSYEMVQALAETDTPVWQADGRHVTAAVVDRVSRTFVRAHGRPTISTYDNQDTFWVPRVDANGKIVGRLYTDGSEA
ncbi:MAG TPA: GSCFA domain-containing protein [Candidatus Saccharimonadales bacterium]|nr:GSCFA domain-containing protein [Candidatus Saccharimonadales bacterium]